MTSRPHIISQKVLRVEHCFYLLQKAPGLSLNTISKTILYSQYLLRHGMRTRCHRDQVIPIPICDVINDNQTLYRTQMICFARISMSSPAFEQLNNLDTFFFDHLLRFLATVSNRRFSYYRSLIKSRPKSY